MIKTENIILVDHYQNDSNQCHAATIKKKKNQEISPSHNVTMWQTGKLPKMENYFLLHISFNIKGMLDHSRDDNMS